MTADEVRQHIEFDVVELLKKTLSEGTMTEERSKIISKTVLDLLQPGMDLTTLYKAIMKLDDECPELSPIVLPFAKQYEEEIAQKATTQVQNYIRIGQYDAAITLAKHVAKQEVKLTQKTPS